MIHALLLTKLSFQAQTLNAPASPFEVSILRPQQTDSVIAETKTLKNPDHAFDQKIEHQAKNVFKFTTTKKKQFLVKSLWIPFMM